jgi:hypothetical protein
MQMRMVCSNFSRTHMDFCINMSFIPLLTSPNFCGIYKGSYKIVVVQMRLLKRGKMLLNELNLDQLYFKNCSTDFNKCDKIIK